MAILSDFKTDTLDNGRFGSLTAEFFGRGIDVGSYVDGEIVAGAGD